MKTAGHYSASRKSREGKKKRISESLADAWFLQHIKAWLFLLGCSAEIMPNSHGAFCRD